MKEHKFYIEEIDDQIEISFYDKNNIKYIVNENNNVSQLKLAIVGSRTIVNEKLIKSLLNCYIKIFGKPIKVISGGAKGPDTIGENWAKENDINTEIFLPDWVKYGRKAGFIRNEDIIKNCDICLAIWDGTSHGTQNDIELCEKYQKDLVLFNLKDCREGTFNGFYYKSYINDIKISQSEQEVYQGENKTINHQHKITNRWLPQPGIINL